MNRTRTAIISAAGGLLGGAVLGAPLISSATTPDDTTDATDTTATTTSETTDDTTTGRDRTDADADAENCDVPGGMPRHHRGGRGSPGGPFWHDGGRIFGDGALTELLGISSEELRERLGDGQTIAEIAEAEGVDVDTVIQTLVDEAQAAIEERSEALEERITDFVNGELPAGPPDWQPAEADD